MPIKLFSLSFKGKILMKNQDGNSTLLMMMLLMLLSFIFILKIYRHQNNYLKIKKLAKTTLCVKSYLNASRAFSKKILKINKLIASIRGLDKISGFIPFLGPVKASAKAAILMLQRVQGLKLIFFQSELFKLKKSCHASSSIFLTPFKTRGIVFKRRSDLVEKRKVQWVLFSNMNFIFKLSLNHKKKQLYGVQLWRK